MQRESPRPYMQFRAHLGARNYLPLSVRSVGRHHVDERWRENFEARWFLELYWTVEGRGCFYVGQRKFEVKAGDVFIYPPGSPHRIASLCPCWDYCWLTFDHADCVQWLQGFGLSESLHRVGPCPVERFEAVASALALGTMQGEYEAAQQAHALLIEASRAKEPAGQSRITQAKVLMDERFAEPELSVQSLAGELAMHRTTLFRLFRAQYGLNPNQYLKNLRLHRALQLIQQGNLPIGEIARSSGFNDPNYLSRLIKQRVGVPARKIRAARPV